MRWIYSGATALIGMIMVGLAFLVSDPETLCTGNMPAPQTPRPGYTAATFDVSRAHLPLPAARCTVTLPEFDSTATTTVIDWPAATLIPLGIILIVVSLLALKGARQQT
ncbi:hypothetical protein [Rhodococcus qingshengii]|uniref:hypothetical protein n=1 Tax=Rhodococcus qingshengii TaxID=334542 RepID=UPI001BE83427|nr:hypothetical protein [Rhodococcus qingshengii]MBT2270672.1 hypothetical protein [Rhodococcus qingshengii]